MSAATFKLPNELDIKSMLGMLYDGIQIKPTDPLDLTLPNLYYGVYIDDQDKLVTLAACDIEFAAYASCSLTLIPPMIAEEVIKKTTLESDMVGNLREVFNIISRLYMGGDSPHLRFDKAYSKADCPDEVSLLMEQCIRRGSYLVTIPRYGAGKLMMAC